MAQLKFYRVETLPETGEVGSLYFVYKGTSPKFYVCTSTGFEQYSDLFSRNFSTSLTDAIANTGDGVVYFTTDTHLIVKDGVIYGTGADLTGYATEQWVEDKGYLTEHQDISGKVNVADFEEATFVTSAALIDIYENKQDQSDNTLLTTNKTIVGAINELVSQIGLPVGNLNIDLQTTEQDALVGDLNIIYFTTDTNRIIYQGKIFSKEGYVYDASLNSFSTNTASAQGESSHAEGYLSETGGTAAANTLNAGTDTTSGAYAHAEGNATIARGIGSHSEGKKTFAYGDYSHAEGSYTITENNAEHAEGKYNKSNSGTISSIGIGESENSRKNAVEVMQNGDTFIHGVGGYDGTNINTTNIKGERFPASIQEVLPKYNKEKRSICFHYNETDGSYNQADADYSFVTGYNNKAHFQQDMLQAGNSFVGGDSNDAYHQNTFVFGKKLFTQWANTFVLGKYNATVSNHDGWGDTVLGVVGDGYANSNGTVTGRNVLLLQGGGDPALHCRGSFKNNASWINDFGEYFEWLDGNPDNEDRIGYMVQLNGDKIELAESFEKCIGVISGTTGFIGGVCAFEWHNKFLHDKWGREIIGEDGNPVINPDYNPELEYIPREQRKEWDVVGLIGQVITRQDGTLEVGGYASCNNGIATNATHGFKVLKIIDNETALLLIK